MTMLGKSDYLFVVLRHGRSCQEMCGTIVVSWRTKRLNSSTKYQTPCLDDPHFKEEEMKSVWRIVTSMLSNCSEMLIHGKNWTT